MTTADFIKSALRQLRHYKSLGDKSLDRVTENQLHTVVADGSNSIAVIVQHMAGNMKSRWTDFLSSDGEKPWRMRDEEFEEHATSKEKILSLWNDGWKLTIDTIATLKDNDIDRTVSIAGEQMSAAEAIHRQIAHYAYHVGQIVLLAKAQAGSSWESLSIPKPEKRP